MHEGQAVQVSREAGTTWVSPVRGCGCVCGAARVTIVPVPGDLLRKLRGATALSPPLAAWLMASVSEGVWEQLT